MPRLRRKRGGSRDSAAGASGGSSGGTAAGADSAGRGPDRELERLLARQNRGAVSKPILELNMRHALVKAAGLAKEQARDADLADLAMLLLEQAQILDGEVPDDPAAFAARLNRLVVRGLPVA